MPTRLIFICHGQLPEEKPKGLALAELIDNTPGFRAFFAENVHSTDDLTHHIFANLERCDMVRKIISAMDGSWLTSTWRKAPS